MKTIAFNGSPRKKHNTASLLEKALEGAMAAGSETEMVHLYDYDFTGCISCFSCKLIGGKSYGSCAVNDPLTPLLQKAAKADVLLLGSPMYLASETSRFRAFFERLIFPYLTYAEEPRTLFQGKIKTGLIYTMGVSEDRIPKVGYDKHFERAQEYLGRIFGHCEMMYSTETKQFDHPEKYFCPGQHVSAREKRHREVFPEDCARAFELGKRLVFDSKGE
ncbi:flavodoxin family protein [Desulfococcaceae bacterium OttesenSCG-928-F15]|nr:flavodoxin family protein [Desulfococcaceae bacterium OttesenSCG-928-F15]